MVVMMVGVQEWAVMEILGRMKIEHVFFQMIIVRKV